MLAVGDEILTAVFLGDRGQVLERVRAARTDVPQLEVAHIRRHLGAALIDVQLEDLAIAERQRGHREGLRLVEQGPGDRAHLLDVVVARIRDAIVEAVVAEGGRGDRGFVHPEIPVAGEEIAELRILDPGGRVGDDRGGNGRRDGRGGRICCGSGRRWHLAAGGRNAENEPEGGKRREPMQHGADYNRAAGDRD